MSDMVIKTKNLAEKPSPKSGQSVFNLVLVKRVTGHGRDLSLRCWTISDIRPQGHGFSDGVVL